MRYSYFFIIFAFFVDKRELFIFLAIFLLPGLVLLVFSREVYCLFFSL